MRKFQGTKAMYMLLLWKEVERSYSDNSSLTRMKEEM